MTSGGHARSGPAPKPGSGRSDARGLTFKSLPAEGYQGDIPEFPMPNPAMREVHWWNWAWRTPQAALWSTPQWSWILPTVADWCRLKVMAEADEVSGSTWTALNQRSVTILFDEVGLQRAGFQIVANEVADKRAESAAEASRPKSARERAAMLRAVGDE